jgi:hypothetical protein
MSPQHRCKAARGLTSWSPGGFCTRAHLGFLPVDVDVAPVSTRAHCTSHHVVQLEDSTGQCARKLLSLGPAAT